MYNRLVARGIIEGSKRPFSSTSLTPRDKSGEEEYTLGNKGLPLLIPRHTSQIR